MQLLIFFKDTAYLSNLDMDIQKNQLKFASHILDATMSMDQRAKALASVTQILQEAKEVIMQLGLKDYEYNPQIVKLDEPSEASLIVFIGHSSLKKSPFTSFFSSIDTNIPQIYSSPYISSLNKNKELNSNQHNPQSQNTLFKMYRDIQNKNIYYLDTPGLGLKEQKQKQNIKQIHQIMNNFKFVKFILVLKISSINSQQQIKSIFDYFDKLIPQIVNLSLSKSFLYVPQIPVNQQFFKLSIQQKNKQMINILNQQFNKAKGNNSIKHAIEALKQEFIPLLSFKKMKKTDQRNQKEYKQHIINIKKTLSSQDSFIERKIIKQLLSQLDKILKKYLNMSQSKNKYQQQLINIFVTLLDGPGYIQKYQTILQDFSNLIQSLIDHADTIQIKKTQIKIKEKYESNKTLTKSYQNYLLFKRKQQLLLDLLEKTYEQLTLRSLNTSKQFQKIKQLQREYSLEQKNFLEKLYKHSIQKKLMFYQEYFVQQISNKTEQITREYLIQILKEKKYLSTLRIMINKFSIKNMQKLELQKFLFEKLICNNIFLLKKFIEQFLISNQRIKQKQQNLIEDVELLKYNFQNKKQNIKAFDLLFGNKENQVVKQIKSKLYNIINEAQIFKNKINNLLNFIIQMDKLKSSKLKDYFQNFIKSEIYLPFKLHENPSNVLFEAFKEIIQSQCYQILFRIMKKSRQLKISYLKFFTVIHFEESTQKKQQVTKQSKYKSQQKSFIKRKFEKIIDLFYQNTLFLGQVEKESGNYDEFLQLPNKNKTEQNLANILKKDAEIIKSQLYTHLQNQNIPFYLKQNGFKKFQQTKTKIYMAKNIIIVGDLTEMGTNVILIAQNLYHHIPQCFINLSGQQNIEMQKLHNKNSGNIFVLIKNYHNEIKIKVGQAGGIDGENGIIFGNSQFIKKNFQSVKFKNQNSQSSLNKKLMQSQSEHLTSNFIDIFRILQFRILSSILNGQKKEGLQLIKYYLQPDMTKQYIERKKAIGLKYTVQQHLQEFVQNILEWFKAMQKQQIKEQTYSSTDFMIVTQLIRQYIQKIKVSSDQTDKNNIIGVLSFYNQFKSQGSKYIPIQSNQKILNNIKEIQQTIDFQDKANWQNRQKQIEKNYKDKNSKQITTILNGFNDKVKGINNYQKQIFKQFQKIEGQTFKNIQTTITKDIQILVANIKKIQSLGIIKLIAMRLKLDISFAAPLLGKFGQPIAQLATNAVDFVTQKVDNNLLARQNTQTNTKNITQVSDNIKNSLVTKNKKLQKDFKDDNDKLMYSVKSEKNSLLNINVDQIKETAEKAFGFLNNAIKFITGVKDQQNKYLQQKKKLQQLKDQMKQLQNEKKQKNQVNRNKLLKVLNNLIQFIQISQLKGPFNFDFYPFYITVKQTQNVFKKIILQIKKDCEQLITCSKVLEIQTPMAQAKDLIDYLVIQMQSVISHLVQMGQLAYQIVRSGDMYDFISSYLKKPLEKNLFYYLNSAWKTFYIQKLKQNIRIRDFPQCFQAKFLNQNTSNYQKNSKKNLKKNYYNFQSKQIKQYFRRIKQFVQPNETKPVPMHATGYSMPVYYWSGYRNYLQLQNLFENSKKGGNYTKFEAKPLFWDQFSAISFKNKPRFSLYHPDIKKLFLYKGKTLQNQKQTPDIGLSRTLQLNKMYYNVEGDLYAIQGPKSEINLVNSLGDQKLYIRSMDKFEIAYQKSQLDKTVRINNGALQKFNQGMYSSSMVSNQKILINTGKISPYGVWSIKLSLQDSNYQFNMKQVRNCILQLQAECYYYEKGNKSKNIQRDKIRQTYSEYFIGNQGPYNVRFTDL